MRLFFAIAIFSIFCTPVGVRAQFAGIDTLSLVVSPQYPRPFETVVITPKSTQINLAASRITTTVDGVVIEESSGEKGISVTLGASGSSTNVRVSATSNGVSYSSEITLRPTDVALVIEPLTTSHPLFDGGVLVAPEGQVRLIAVTDFRTSNGSRIPPSSLSYTWRVGNRILAGESGLGRTTLTASAPVQYRTSDVSVTVSTPDDTMIGYAKTNVAPSNPKLLAYRADPLLGVDLVHALVGTIPLINNEESFVAVPFFYRTLPSMSWLLNGELSSSDSTLTVRTTDTNIGKASVSVSARGSYGEQASTAFSITFGRTTGLFNF